MLGPNVKSDLSRVYYHHREERFHNLLRELENTFIKKFGLDDYVLLFLTGSGTMANEAVIFSYKTRFDFWYIDAEFGRRLFRLSEAHRKNSFYPGAHGIAFPLYETSISRLNNLEQSCFDNDVIFLDMVSAFPYYLPPKNTAIWTTVSSKQIGAFPVLGIVGIRKDLLKGNGIFRHIANSALSLTEHLRFREKQETLTTPAIPLYVDLLETIIKFNREKLIKRIQERRRQIVCLVGKKNIIGEGPVVTLKSKSWFMPLAEKFKLYKNATGDFQVFLWSGNNCEYKELYKELERLKK